MLYVLPLLILFSLLSFNIQAQNLVRNGSFEDIIACPSGRSPNALSSVTLAYPWFCTNTICWEIELFHACCDPIYRWGVPDNSAALGQYAFHGNGYTLLLLFAYYIGGRGELIQTELITPLVKDSVYCVEFYVIIAPRHSHYAIGQIEVYFTYDTLKQSPVTFTFPDTPSVDIHTGILNDTVNWTRISTTYTAKGGERYFSVGTKAYKPMIFEPFTHSTQYNPTGTLSLYFFDAISVYPCNAPVYTAGAGEERLLCRGDVTVLGTHDLEQYEYFWFLPGNTTDTLSKQALFSVAPTHTTTYVLQVTDFKFITTWDTVTVFVEECGPLEMTIYPNPTTDKATFAFNRTIPDQAELRIFDMAGKLVSVHPLRPDEQDREFTISIISLAKGVYTCRVAFGETETVTGKLVVYK